MVYLGNIISDATGDEWGNEIGPVWSAFGSARDNSFGFVLRLYRNAADPWITVIRINRRGWLVRTTWKEKLFHWHATSAQEVDYVVNYFNSYIWPRAQQKIAARERTKQETIEQEKAWRQATANARLNQFLDD